MSIIMCCTSHRHYWGGTCEE